MLPSLNNNNTMFVVNWSKCSHIRGEYKFYKFCLYHGNASKFKFLVKHGGSKYLIWIE